MILIAFVSCEPKAFQKKASENVPTYKMVTRTTPVEKWIMKYVKEHPSFLNNNATIMQASEELLKALKDTVNKNWIEGIPVSLKTINKVNKGYMAQFGTYFTESSFTYRKPIKEINFDIIAAIPDSLVSKLKEDVTYKLSGDIVSQLDNANATDTMLGTSSSYWNNEVGFEVNPSDKGKSCCLSVDLGILFCDISKVSIFTGRDKIKVSIK